MAVAFGSREWLAQARALVFDFDGTLVDSAPIKRRAFEACFAEFAERFDDILPYCVTQHHTPRDVKFRYVYEQILRRPYTPAIDAQLHARFEAASTQQIIAALALPGAEAFLRAAARRTMTVLLSTTPHDVLVRILEGRGWRELFRVVRGAPVDKAMWLEAFRASHGWAEDEVICFGDTPEDAGAAAAAGCRFVGVGMASSGDGVAVQHFEDLLSDGWRDNA